MTTSTDVRTTLFVLLVTGWTGCIIEPIDTSDGDGGGTGDSNTEADVTGDPATVDCWQHDNQQDCTAEDPSCVFEPGLARYQFQDNVCTTSIDFGWCAPGGIGGSAVSSVWHHAATGRVIVLGFDGPGAPGWNRCAGGGTGDGCHPPPSNPACAACLCP